MTAATRRALILAAAAAAAGGEAWAAGAPPAAKKPAPKALPPKTAPLPGDMVMGNPKAAVTLFEYASASCPHCAHFAIEIFPAIRARYIDTGKVRFVMREILTPPVQVAAAGFLLARRAGAARYFGVVEAMYRGQPEIYADEGRNAGYVIHRIGREAGGLTDDEINACLGDEAGLKALNARVRLNSQVGKIEGTPTVDVGSFRYEDELTVEGLSALLDKALAPKPRPKAKKK